MATINLNVRKQERQNLREKGYTEPEKYVNYGAKYTITNQNGQILGTVSYSAKEAIENNKLDSYKPKNDEEKRVIDSLMQEAYKNSPYGKIEEGLKATKEIEATGKSPYLKDSGVMGYQVKKSGNKYVVAPRTVSGFEGAFDYMKSNTLESFDKKEDAEKYVTKLEKANDFKIGSRYESTAKENVNDVKPSVVVMPGSNPMNPTYTGMYNDTGFEDVIYDYINGNKTARERLRANEMATGQFFAGYDKSFLEEMTDDEVSVFNYLYKNMGKEKAHEYLKNIQGTLAGRQRNALEKQFRDEAKENPISSSLFTILTSPAKGLSYVGQVADYLDDGKIDQNAGYNKFSYTSSAIRDEVSKKVEKNWGKAGSWGYQLGMSMGDMLMNSAMGAGNEAFTLALMGAGAAADGVISAKDRGLSDNQAFALGTINGAVEVVTEKIGYDKLFKTDILEKGIKKYIFGNIASNAAEEGTAALANTITDIFISKDKSEWSQDVAAYMKEGDSKAKAIGKAVGKQALNIGLDALGGALMGGTISGVNAGTTYVAANNSYTTNRTDIRNIINTGLGLDKNSDAYKNAVKLQEKQDLYETGYAKKGVSDYEVVTQEWKNHEETTKAQGKNVSEVKEAVIKTGLESPKESEAYKNAKALSKKKNVSDYDLGKQYLLNVEQVSQETTEVKTRFAPVAATENVINLEKMLANEGVAEKDIEKIVSDAVTLESSLAKTPTTNMTAEMVERANGTITNQAKNNLAMNGAKNADYWGIYGTNLKILSKSDKTIDEGFIDTYADAYAEGLKEGNSISYHSLAQNTDNVAKTLKSYVLTGAVPETMRGTNIVEKAGENLKGIIQSAVGSVSTAHKIVYGEGTNIARQAEAIKSGDFSSVISGESNNYKTTPSFNNAINTDEIRMVMNSTFKEGAMENIAEIMSATTGGVDMGVFAYKLAEYYQKNGNITPFRKYFADGGIAVAKTLEDITTKTKTTSAKEKTAPPKISILDMEEVENETTTEETTKEAENEIGEVEKSAEEKKEKAKTESEKDKEIKESVPEKEEEKAKDNSGKTLKRLGQKGKAAYQKVLEIEQSMHSEMSEYEVLREFEKSYRAGREGVKNTDGSRLTEQSRKVAEKAGKDDRKNKLTAKENVSKKSEERVWQPKKATEKTVEKESVSETKEPKSEKSSDSRENIEVQGKGAVKWSSLHPRQQKAIVFMEGFAKAANMKLVFVANSPNFDGAYDISGDTMYLDIYAGVDPTNKLSDIIIPTASHELTHWMHYQAPVLWNKLSSAVFSALEEVDGINRADRINSEIERLKGKGLVHNELVAEDEIVARACEDMLAQSEMGKKVFKSLSETEQKTITSKIKDILTNLKNWISDFLSSYKPSNRKEAKKIRQAQDNVNEILKLWNEGIAKSVEVSKAETKAEAFIGNDVYEQYGVEFDVDQNADEMLLSEKGSEEEFSIKKQIEHNQTKLNSMDAVARVDTNTHFKNAKDAYGWAAEQLKQSGYKAERKDFGVVIFDEKRIKNGLRYLDTHQEYAALALIPKVIKRGITLGNHDNHKGRGYNTVTFGAPIEIDGFRGDMAVVVRMEGKNYYKLHRVIMPESILSENKRRSPAERAAATTNVVDTPTDRASKNNISQLEKNVKENFLLAEKYDVMDIPFDTYSEMESHFGTTKNFDVAGYLLSNGKMLDFSGKHWGDNSSTFRQVDHREIQEVLEDADDGVHAMVGMISNGNIRLMPETGGINLSTEPNKLQTPVLREYINYFKGDVVVDIDAVGGDTIHSVSYSKGTSPSKIMSDLSSYFQKGVVPSGTTSKLAEFRYSEKESLHVTEQEDADYMTAVKKGDMETAQKMVDEEAKRKGYNSPKLYHGTNSFGFTKFDLSKMDDKRTIFLTNNKRIASTYSGVSGERKISDVYNKDIEKLDIENIAKELNKFVKEYYKDTFEFANYNYSYYNLKKLNDLINVVNDGLVELTSEVEQKIAEYANKIAFDSDDANTKIYKQLVSLKERLDKWDYNNLSTPIYLLIHHTDVFADNSAKYGELEANIRLMNDLRKNENISDGVVVEESLGRYSIEVMSKDDAVSKLKDLEQKGNYALYAKMSKPLIIDGRAQNWNNIRRWSDGLVSDKKTFELADDDEFYYLKNKKTGQIIKEASVDILKTYKMSLSETIDFLINKYKNILAIKYENVKTTREIAKVAKDMGYDSVVIKNITDNGGRNYNVGMEETANIYMLFDSNNVKSADPVSYDNKGNIIPLSERFNTENPDIRYSEADTTHKKPKYSVASKKVTKTAEQIYRMQNRDIIQFIRDEYDKSEKFMPRIEDVKKSANKLGKGYTGDKNLAYEFGKLYKEVKAAIAYGERTDATEQEIKRKWNEVQNKIDDIAMDIVMNNEVKNDENWQMIKDFRRYLHGRTIKVPAEWHADFDAQGGIDGFRKHNRGRFFVSYTKGESIETLYPEMRGMFGNLLPDISNPADQLIAISDFLDEMAVTFENPYDSDIEAAAESMSLEIMADMLVNIREVGDDVRSKRIEKLHRVLQEERLKRYHALNRVKERQERKIREATEKRKASAEKKADMAARQRLLAVAKKLESLAKKSDAEKQAEIQKLIGHLDLAAVSITDKKLEKLKDIKNFYDGMKNDPDFIEDKRIEKTLERLEKKQISDLDLYDVQELTDVLLAIDHKIRTDAYAIETEDKRKISVQAKETMRNIENSSGSKASGIGKFADNLIVGVLTPTREARRITGYVDNDPLYLGMKNMQSGQVDMFDYAMKAEKMFEKYTNDKKFMESITGAKAKTYTYNITEKDAKGREIGKRKIELTAGMRISLLLHNLNSSNQGHMKIGGVTIPDAKLYKAGKMQEAYARGQKIYLHPSDIKAITKDITEKEREYARVVWRYYNEFAKSEINRVSLKLKGYEIARVKNYFPIDTNKDFSKQDFELMNIDGTIEGMGFLKERIEAKNPIMLIDVASVLEKSIRMNSKYVGLAIPVRNMSLLLGKSFSEYGEATSTEKQVYGLNYTMEKGYYGSVMDTISTKWGINGKNYINKIMQDMQGKTNEQGPVAKVVEKIGSRYVRGILSWNPKVAFNQVASIPSAIPEVGYKALARSLFDFGRVNTDLIAEYTPLQYMRSKGAYDTTIADMARAKKGILAAVDNVVDKVDLMTWTDTLMTRKLWKAAIYNIKHTRSDLKEGTREFYEAVAEVYVDIMQNTQPNVSMMERPQYLRSDPVTKMLMAFKGEPFKNVNLIYESAGNLRAKARQLKQIQNNQTATSKEIAEAEERLKQANNQFVTTAVSQVVATLVYGIEASIFQLIYGKIDDYWDDEEEKVTFESWLVGVLKDSAINTVTQLPFANYVVDIIGSLNGGRYYSPYTPPALDSVDTATKSIPALVSAAQDIISGKINLQQFGFKAYDAIEDISTFLGIPTANVRKHIKPVIKGVIKASISNEYLEEYAVLKAESAIAEKKENNKGEIVTKGSSEAFDVLYKAMENGDEEAYNTMVKDLQDRGISYTDIESAMQSRAKKDENFNLDTSLNMYAGVEERGKTEKYKKYIDSAEELGIDEELLKKVVDAANSKKKYKERKMDAEKIINNASLDFESEEFLKNIIADSYSVNDLSKEQYIEYSKTRATYLQKVDNEIDSEGMSEREFRKVYNKASDLAEEYALSEASDGEYSMRAKWMYYAVDAEEEVGMTTGEFLKVYEEYGSTIYSTPSLITHEVGYDVSDYLEFHKLTKDIKGDKDENGKDIEGRTKQDKIIEVISGMNVSDEMKAFLFSTEYKSEKNNPWKDSLRINYKVYIEEE